MKPCCRAAYADLEALKDPIHSQYEATLRLIASKHIQYCETKEEK